MAASWTVDHRLCVCASGSLMIVILPCFRSISVSFRHLGQNRGKFINTVSFRLLVGVLPPQTGQMTHFFCPATANQGARSLSCLKSQESANGQILCSCPLSFWKDSSLIVCSILQASASAVSASTPASVSRSVKY